MNNYAKHHKLKLGDLPAAGLDGFARFTIRKSKGKTNIKSS
jgi:hypothetical protein